MKATHRRVTVPCGSTYFDAEISWAMLTHIAVLGCHVMQHIFDAEICWAMLTHVAKWFLDSFTTRLLARAHCVCLLCEKAGSP